MNYVEYQGTRIDWCQPMNSPTLSQLSLLPLLLIGILISGCNKTLPLIAEKSNDKLIFVLRKQDGGDVLAIQDFAVQKTQCETDCTMWSLVNKLDKNGELTITHLSQGVIRYGEIIEDLDTKVEAKELASGVYSAGGTAVFLDSKGRIKYSRILFVDFHLDGNGKVISLN